MVYSSPSKPYSASEGSKAILPHPGFKAIVPIQGFMEFRGSAMISADTKRKLRHAALAGTLVSFPLLYLGPVTLENPAVTLAGLAAAGVTAALAWLAF